MANYNELITRGISLDCSSIYAPIGVEKDLIVANYSDLDKEATLNSRETDESNENLGGLTKIVFKEGSKIYLIKGRENSIAPKVSSEEREDGKKKYTHSLSFTVFSKRAYDKKSLEKFADSRVVAITIDKSTGLYELFGIDRGLEISSISREYTGSQNSNFYSISMSTPSRAKLKENSLTETSVKMEIVGEINLQSELQHEL